MRQDAITEGACYIGKGGRRREVVRVRKKGLASDIYHGRPFVIYWTVEHGRGRVQMSDCTLQSFARWAERQEDATGG